MVKKTKQPVLMVGVIVIILLTINLIFSITNFYNIGGSNSSIAIEQLKAGGEENFEIMKKIFKSPTYQTQQKMNLLQTLESFGGETEVEEMNIEDKEIAISDTSKNEKMINTFKDITDDAYIIGNKEARFTILEYSELLCPYCKRQHNQGTIDAVLEEFDGKVNTAYRHFIVHPAAKKFAEASECIADIEGEEAYAKFIDEAFELNEAINDTTLKDIIKDMGRSSKKINKCIEAGTFSDKIDAQTQEGRSLFGVKGTPGNVIIDNSNGKFILIPGAYPPEKFIEEINNLMK